jgi:hypothetical protein
LNIKPRAARFNHVLVLERHAATRTTFIRATGEGFHAVRHPLARNAMETRFKFSEVRAIDVGKAKDSDGDPMYQARMQLIDGRVLQLQGQPIHGAKRTETVVSDLRRALGIAH